MMVQTGVVIDKSGDSIKVMVKRESSCGGNCASCKSCAGNFVTIDCRSGYEFEIGDEVSLEMPNSVFFKNAFWGCGFSIILMILGAIIGSVINRSDGASVIGAMLGLIVGIMAVKIMYRKYKAEVTALPINEQKGE